MKNSLFVVPSHSAQISLLFAKEFRKDSSVPIAIVTSPIAYTRLYIFRYSKSGADIIYNYLVDSDYPSELVKIITLKGKTSDDGASGLSFIRNHIGTSK